MHVRGRVLVMDNEQTILDITAEALTFMGYTVGVAKDGREAEET
jgi:CheY-like chemotaxis protein